jgi:hypothetical protein
VKDETHLKDLRDNLNVSNVFVQDNFNDYENLIRDLRPKILFDYLGGELPTRILSRMPEESCLVVVGAFTNQNITFNPLDLLMKSQKIEGFWLFTWLKK